MEAYIMNPDQTAPLGSSLIWVHSMCNKDYRGEMTQDVIDSKMLKQVCNKRKGQEL